MLEVRLILIFLSGLFLTWTLNLKYFVSWASYLFYLRANNILVKIVYREIEKVLDFFSCFGHKC